MQALSMAGPESTHRRIPGRGWVIGCSGTVPSGFRPDARYECTGACSSAFSRSEYFPTLGWGAGGGLLCGRVL